MKTVYVVTHGDKFGGMNPHMTPKGWEQISTLRNLLPQKPSCVACGTGNRHLDMAKALNLQPSRLSTVFGDGDSLDMVDGEKIIILTNGFNFKMDALDYSSISDMTPAAKELIATLPDESVVCSGRPFMMMLGKMDAKSATVYKITVDDDGKIQAIN